MTTYVWTGAASDGNWSTAGNWSPNTGLAPGAADTAMIDLSVAGAINVSNQAILDLTINSFVTLNVNDGTSFTFGSAGSAAATFANSGTLALSSTNDATQLIVAAPTLSLTGTGTVVLDNDGANYIDAGTAGNELDNVSNLIEGAGTIGGTNLSFVNGTAGILKANQSVGLTLNTGTSTTLNSGLLEATTGGALTIESTVTNGTLGRISAAGATVYLQGADIQGGTISSSGGADVIVDSGATLDGSSNTVTNTGTVAVTDGHSLDLLGTISNKGTISLGSTNDGTYLNIGPTTGTTAGTVTLTGSGQVVLDNNPSNFITDGIAGDTLVNLNNTISGGGYFNGTLTLVNDATIDANTATALVINTSATDTNSGTLEATGAGNANLVINSVINNGTAGIILASANNVNLENGSLQGGTIKTSGGGQVVETATGTLDGSAHAVTNLGTVQIYDGNALNLLGSIVNNGTIALGSTNDGTYLEMASTTVSLSGTGIISLSNNGANYIIGSPSTDELYNVSNTIEGAGQLGGAAAIALVNGTHGVIDGDLSIGLTLNVGAVAVANSGLIEATGTGTLTIDRTTVNDSTGGTILANAADVNLNGGIIEGGVINSSGVGAVVAVGGSNLLDGTSQAVTNKGNVAINDGQSLALAGTIADDGTIQLNSTNDGTSLEVNSATVTLNGGGSVVLNDDGANYIYGATAADVLDNVNNTIKGSGQFGDNQLTVINGPAGTISATGTNSQLVIHTGSSSFTNSGLIEATGPAGLQIYYSTISNGTLGVISGANGIVYLNSSTIQGGKFTQSGAGGIVAYNSSTLDGSVHTVTNDATVTLDDGNNLYLLGTITNAGTIALGSTNDGTSLILGPSSTAGTVTLTGSGTVAMSNDAANYIYGNDGGSTTLINLNNTISGGGTLGDNGLVVINDGVINASAATQMVVDGDSLVTNNKLLESTSTGGLLINDTTVSNGTAGTIAASGGTVTIQSATIKGGTLTGTGGFYTDSSATLDGTANKIVNNASLTLYDGNNLYLLGTISNAGTIALGSTNDGTSLILGPTTGGTVTLTGSGDIVMSNDAANYIYSNDGGGVTLINLNNTISGGGTLGYNGLVVINDAVINANTATALVIDGASTFTNNDLIESAGPGGLVIYNTTVSNGTAGTIAASGGAVTIQSATIEGGTLTGTGGFHADSSATLDGTANKIVNNASLTLYDGNNLYLLGTISNAGTIALGSTNDGTSLILGPTTGGTVTLTGSGDIVMSNDAANYIYSNDGGGVTLINLNNTISGGGTLGYNGLRVTNDSIVNANDSTALVIDGGTTFTNNDLIESTGSGGLTIYDTTVSNGAAGTISALSGNITIQAATIEGGLITSTTSYTIYTSQSSVFGATTGTLTNTGSIVLQDGNNAYLAGVIDNNGSFTIGSTNDITQLILDTPTVTLTGTGSIVLSNDGGNYFDGGGVLDNVSNTIEGGGNFGNGEITLINGGILEADDPTALTVNLAGTSTILASGQFLAAGGALNITAGTFTNAGLIQADDGGSVTFEGASTLLNNANNGTLSGGSYGAVSTGDGATLSITGSAVSTLAATIILSGAASTIEFGGSTIDSTLGSIAAGGTLSLANGRNFSVAGNSGTLTDSGLISLSASTLTANSLVIATGGAVSGTGTLEASVSDSGTITASGGTLVVADVYGTGTLAATSGSTIELEGATTSGPITGAGTLQVDPFYEGLTMAGNTIAIATVDVTAGADIFGYGTLSGAVIDNGSLFANGGVLVVDGAFSGTGSLVSDGTASIDLAGGGTYAGSIGGSVTVGGALTLTAGATLVGNVVETANITLQSVSVTNTAADTFDITASSGKTVTLGSSGIGSSFTNAGSLLANGAGIADIAVAIFDNTGSASATSGTLLIKGVLLGSGTLSASAGAVVDLAQGGTLSQTISGAGTLQLDSATYSIPAGDITIETVKVDAGAALSTTGKLTGKLIDNGTVAASSGTLLISGSLSGTGVLSAGVGAVVDLELGDTLTESISGAGTLQLDMGTYTVAAKDITISTVKVDSGATLSGYGTLAGALVDSGVVTASGGTLFDDGTLSGAGTLSAASGKELFLSGGGTFAGAISGAGKVDVTKAITLSAGASLSTAELLAEANVTLASANVTATAADRVVLYASSGTTVTLGATGTSTFTNLGTLVAEDTGTALVSAPFVNDGLAEVTAGTLVIAGALSGTGALSASSATLLDLKAGGTVSGAISGAGTLQLDGATYSLSGADITIGTVKVDAGAGLSGHGTLTGALVNSGVVTASGGTLLDSGALSGAGTLSAASGEQLELSGGGTFAGAISGAGKVVVAKAITLSAGASLSTAELLAEANVTLASVTVTNTAADHVVLYASTGSTVTLGATGTGGFTNLGTLVAEDTGTALVSAPFVNNGLAEVTAGTLVIAGALGGTGKLSTASGTVLDLKSGGTLSQAISGAGTLQLDGATYSLSANTITAGTVKVDAGAGLSGHGTLTGALADAGVVTASGGTLLESGGLSGAGTLSAASGEELEVSGGGTFSGAITGAGKVVVAKSVTLGAGASLSASSLIAEANVTLASASVTNTASDRFALYATTGTTVTLAGTGTFTNLGTFQAEEPGSAVVSTAFTNSGTVSALSGTLSFLSSVAGTGTMDISAGATLSLELGTGSGQVVDFLSTTGVTDLFNPLDFAGTIKGFGGSDQVFLENTTYTSFGFTNNLLTVKDGSSTVASLKITETSNHFSLTNEDSGVLIKFT